MLKAGWRVSVQGFCSDGRHRVQIHRVLDFGAPWDANAASRLAGLQAGLSTRLGAVLRHASHRLAAQPVQGRWVLLLGDGEPHDIDEHLNGQLAADAHVAVQAARRDGVRMACLRPLDAEADSARAIFGAAGTQSVGNDGAVWMRSIMRLLQQGA